MSRKSFHQELEQRFEVLERETTERQEQGEKWQEYARNLEFLSKTTMELVELSAEKNIYQFIGERLKELVGDSIVIINSFDCETNKLTVRAVVGFGRFSKSILNLVGRNPVGMSFELNNEEARARLLTGKLVKGPKGLYELAFETIPEAICNRIEVLIGLGEIHGIGFAWKGEIFGSAMIITRRGKKGLKEREIIETFINQTAVALQRKHAEEALQRAHNELEMRVAERTAELLRANAQLMTEINEREQAEEALRDSEERYRQLVEYAPAGICEFDLRMQRLVTVNDVLCEYTGYTKEEFLFMHPYDFMTGETRKLYDERLKAMLGGEAFPDTVEYKVRGKNGKELWLILNTRLVYEEGIPGVATIVVHDITDRRHAEEALRESEMRLRSLSSQLMKAQEKERARLSKELHDELGQALALLKHRVRSIQSKLAEGHLSLQQECDDTRRYIDQIIKNVRRLSRDLSPSILEDLGLSSALRWLAESFTKEYSVTTSFDIENVDRFFSHEAQTNIYRISQEALTNIAKHAEAGRVTFAIRKNENRVSFAVEDDGIGFDAKEMKMRPFTEKGLGLATMEERAHMLGAFLDITSHVGKGTRITLKIPIQGGGTP